MTDTFDLAAMVAELMQAEGTVLFVYDDATGLPITRGTTVKGNPTIGTGRNVAKGSTGISMAEMFLLLGNDIVRAAMILDADPDWNRAGWGWRTSLNPVRQRALINLAINLGDGGLDGFIHFRADLEAEDYAGAGDQLEESAWWGQVGVRGPRVQHMIVTGTVPPDEPAAAIVDTPANTEEVSS